MEAQQELDRLREMNRLRAKKHYDAKKDEINAKRREKYLASLISQQEINLAKKETHTNPIFSYDYICDELEEREMNKRSKSKYLDDLKRFVILTDCQDNVITCINDYENLTELPGFLQIEFLVLMVRLIDYR